MSDDTLYRCKGLKDNMGFICVVEGILEKEKRGSLLTS